ncbi:RyR domain-containing protein [Acinetobacter thermotolerans]|uniref:RyR domain-containing protein n=1 Tax=Acinetobacter thermotolerans TaxID=3151487 RepID=UPI00325BCDCC
MSKALLIAQICHTINAAYCLATGDDSQLPWNEAQEAQRQSAVMGVEKYLENPDITPEQLHEAWYQHKLGEGWEFGEVKDYENKKHPCMVPYDQLPQEQKVKDYLFRATVESVSALIQSIPKAPAVSQDDVIGELRTQLTFAQAKCAEYERLLGESARNKVVDGVAVRYVGSRDFVDDHLFKTGLTFVSGQVRILPKELALKFDQYLEFEIVPEGEVDTAALPVDDTGSVMETLKQQQLEEQHERDQVLDELDQIADIATKKDLVAYAKEKYGLEYSSRKTEAQIREELTAYVQQFGTQG